MLKILRIIFSLIAGILAIYSLITNNNETMPIICGFLGLAFVVMGLTEWKKDKKAITILLFATAGFGFYVVVSSFFY
ncbi:DUF3953 domain-containing protein [Niallia taxi]|uniref:DUF3953 domain-containing protein n=1 Tax=Niallia taxi TaxID=2499688 RepID=UPI001247783D|nr:DUF3953 domain-containing protein [Niallia taxi]MDK8641887.1 DUF3953 domain-containing protein [Niallia taxi]MED4054587.1 DUF3953 domain-containing protein [Niallia taxi]MED4121995.1 DUF3953 domain-containing protein [Niallia taxi]